MKFKKNQLMVIAVIFVALFLVSGGFLGSVLVSENTGTDLSINSLTLSVGENFSGKVLSYSTSTKKPTGGGWDAQYPNCDSIKPANRVYELKASNAVIWSANVAPRLTNINDSAMQCSWTYDESAFSLPSFGVGAVVVEFFVNNKYEYSFTVNFPTQAQLEQPITPPITTTTEEPILLSSNPVTQTNELVRTAIQSTAPDLVKDNKVFGLQPITLLIVGILGALISYFVILRRK